MQNEQEFREQGSGGSALTRIGVPVLALLLFCTTAVSLLYLARERNHVRELAASRDEIKTAFTQTRAQLDEMSARLNALAASQARLSAPQDEAPAARAALAPAPRRAAAPRRAPQRVSASDPRFKKIETQLSEQQKQLASAQEEARKAREELQGRLDSTRDELSGSIARNHDELVELQKRGERNYVEFELVKSKQFQRTGSIGLSLRKADVKHRRYDLNLLVDDAQLEKKKVNLYEPILIYLADHPQPVELVVNQITKDRIKGYLSEPKYKKSDLAAQVSSGAKPQELTPR